MHYVVTTIASEDNSVQKTDERDSFIIGVFFLCLNTPDTFCQSDLFLRESLKILF